MSWMAECQRLWPQQWLGIEDVVNVVQRTRL